MCDVRYKIVDEDDLVAGKRIRNVGLAKMVGRLSRLQYLYLLERLQMSTYLRQSHARVSNFVAPSWKTETVHTNGSLAHHFVIVAFTKIREIDMFEGPDNKRDVLW